MIDLHSHIIPKIDDGSGSIEETFNILKEAVNNGFTDIISTSHYIENYYEADVEERKAWITALQMNLNEKKIPINLHIGTEAYASLELKQFVKDNKVATLSNSRYLLFELPMNSKPKYLEEVIYDILDLKLIPIIAHPERYAYVQQNPNMLIELINKGVMFQSNFGSIIGLYGKNAKNTVEKLLKSDMIHFLGTDTHKQNTIYPMINEILIKLEKTIGKDKIKQLTETNPGLVLENKRIEMEEPKEIKKSFFDKIRIR